MPIGRPRAVVHADQPGDSEQDLSCDAWCDQHRIAPSSDRLTPTGQVPGDVTVEPASHPSVARKVNHRTVTLLRPNRQQIDV